jgi:hypothetical protein
MTQPRLRSRAMTEQAAHAAVDQACRALRLPTIRARVEEIMAAATREQLSYWGFWRSCCWPSATTGTGAAASAGSKPPGSPGKNGWPISTSTPIAISTQPPSIPGPR